MRYAAVAAHTLLAMNKPAFDRLVAAVEEGAPVFECILAIEGKGKWGGSGS